MAAVTRIAGRALAATIERVERAMQITHPDQIDLARSENPMCARYLNRIDHCRGCPVFETTRRKLCATTPRDAVFAAWERWSEGAGTEAQFKAALRKWHAFLLRVRAEMTLSA